MIAPTSVRQAGAPRRAAHFSHGLVAMLMVAMLPVAACSPSARSTAPAPTVGASTTPPSPDPRVGLSAGRTDAGQASWNMRLLTNVPTPPGAATVGVQLGQFRNIFCFVCGKWQIN